MYLFKVLFSSLSLGFFFCFHFQQKYIYVRNIINTKTLPNWKTVIKSREKNTDITSVKESLPIYHNTWLKRKIYKITLLFFYCSEMEHKSIFSFIWHKICISFSINSEQKESHQRTNKIHMGLKSQKQSDLVWTVIIGIYEGMIIF